MSEYYSSDAFYYFEGFDITVRDRHARPADQKIPEEEKNLLVLKAYKNRHIDSGSQVESHYFTVT